MWKNMGMTAILSRSEPNVEVALPYMHRSQLFPIHEVYSLMQGP